MCHNVRALENAGHDLVVVARGTVRPPGYAATGNGNGISVNGGIFTLVTPKPDGAVTCRPYDERPLARCQGSPFRKGMSFDVLKSPSGGSCHIRCKCGPY